MTLKEKFGKLFMKGRDTTEFEKITEDFAIGFAEWFLISQLNSSGKYLNKTKIELLEIYKKETEKIKN